MSRSRIVTVVAVMSCLLVSACGTSSKKPTGILGQLRSPAATSGPTVTSGPSGAKTATPSAANGTPTAISGATTPANVSLKVSVNVDKQDPVTTSDCPYTFTFHGRITVNKGPVNVTYDWKSSQGGPKSSGTIHFGGTGPQFAVLSTQVTAAVVNRQLYESLLLDGLSYDRSHGFTVFNLTCAASATTPVADVTHDVCPYQTTFTSIVRVAVGPQTVDYEWILSDGSGGSGSLDFSADGPQVAVLGQHAEIKGLTVLGKFSAVVHITSAGGVTTAPAIVTCDQVNHT